MLMLSAVEYPNRSWLDITQISPHKSSKRSTRKSISTVCSDHGTNESNVPLSLLMVYSENHTLKKEAPDRTRGLLKQNEGGCTMGYCSSCFILVSMNCVTFFSE